MSTKNTVFEYKNYLDYLKVKLATRGASRGMRSRLAESTQTKPAFISKVLAGGINLSPEHIPPTNALLAHSPEEAHFFTLQVLKARAGTKTLEAYYEDQIKIILEQRNQFLNRVNIQERVSHADQVIYYSQWYYLAIHVLVSIPQFQTREAISHRLEIPLPVVSKAISDLESMGLVEKKSGRYIAGKKRIHLPKDSPLVSTLHHQFRQRAVQKIALPSTNDFHFSFGMSISKNLFDEYRGRILDLIAEFEEKMTHVKDEEFYALNIDLFKY